MRSLTALFVGGLILLGGQAGIALAQAPVPAPERFVLSGVIMFDDGQGVAWLQEPSLTQNRVVAKRPGDSVGPWRLTRLLGNRVELEGPAGTVVVPLHNAAAVGMEPGASAPVARARRERASAGEAPAEAAPAAGSPEGGAAASAQASRGAGAGRRGEMLAETAERGQRDGERRQRDGEERQRDGEGRGRGRPASAARSGSSPQFQNPNVISLSPGDPRRGGGLSQLFGGQ